MAILGHVRLRARTETSRVPALRRTVEQLLADDLRPPGMPGEAILVVRTLDNLPALEAHTRGAWPEVVRAEVTALYRTAAQPFRGGVPADAQSVLFRDEAEVLACFTRDVLAQVAWSRWYYRHVRLGEERRPLLPQRGAGASTAGGLIAPAWQAVAHAVPAAWGLLAPGERGRVLRALSPREVSAVVMALHRAFAVPPMVLGVHAGAEAPQVPAAVDISTAGRPGLASELVLMAGAATLFAGVGVPPWRQWPAVGEEAALSPQAQYLAALCVALREQPAFARSEAFAAAAARWLAWELRRSGERVAPASSARRSTAASGGIGRAHSTETTYAKQVEVRAGVEQPSGGAAPLLVEHGPPAGQVGGVSSSTDDPGQGPSVEAVAFRRTPAEEGGAWTGLGGVLYLLHTLPWLALPGMWAEHLGAWAVLELLARRLLADGRVGDPTDAGDALWAFLAALDGRLPGVPLGAALPPQATYTVQEHELAGAPLWVQRELIALWEEGVGLPCEQDQPPPAGVSGSAWRWAGPRAALLRVLLRRVLGAAPLASVLHVHGLLRASTTHVDLYLPAQAANIAVRRAGLDANPGWYPDCGYIVTFYFVEEAA